MKKIKKMVAMLMIVAMAFGGMVFGATESAQVIITTSVSETTANSGIRVVESFTPSTGAAFDVAFSSAGSVLSLASGKDTATESATGQFVVLVRRPVDTPVVVSISGASMALVVGGTGIIPTIPYKILGTASATDSTIVAYVDYIVETPVVSGTYTTGADVDGIIRDAKAFTYEIPESTSAPLGTYSATVTFTITVS